MKHFMENNLASIKKDISIYQGKNGHYLMNGIQQLNTTCNVRVKTC